MECVDGIDFQMIQPLISRHFLQSLNRGLPEKFKSEKLKRQVLHRACRCYSHSLLVIYYYNYTGFLAWSFYRKSVLKLSHVGQLKTLFLLLFIIFIVCCFIIILYCFYYGALYSIWHAKY